MDKHLTRELNHEHFSVIPGRLILTVTVHYTEYCDNTHVIA